MDKLTLAGNAAEPVYVPDRSSAALYRAYMKGAYDAMRQELHQQDSAFKTAVAAMAFGLMCWVAMMFFVFKS